jgi:hypothetical protein
MGMWIKIILDVSAVVLLIVIVIKLYRGRKTHHTLEITSEIYAVWAALGPFIDGDASSKAMKHTYAAVMGVESIKDSKIANIIKKHKVAYDANPDYLEVLRQKAISSSSGVKFIKSLELARSYAAAEEHYSEVSN